MESFRFWVVLEWNENAKLDSVLAWNTDSSEVFTSFFVRYIDKSRGLAGSPELKWHLYSQKLHVKLPVHASNSRNSTQKAKK